MLKLEKEGLDRQLADVRKEIEIVERENRIMTSIMGGKIQLRGKLLNLKRHLDERYDFFTAR